MLGKKQFAAVIVLALSQFLPSTARVDDAVDPKPTDCLRLGIVRRQVVVDDATILYWLKDGRTYVNQLGLQCPGLKEFGPTYPSQQFGSHFPRSSRVCAGDHIWANPASRKTLHPDDVAPQILCPLGQFFPISEEGAEEMLNPALRQSVSIAPSPPSTEAGGGDPKRP
jgi:hypothetical protein